MKKSRPNRAGRDVLGHTHRGFAELGTPGGTVTFKDGATTLGSAQVVGGQATIVTASLTAGAHAITATYGGDDDTFYGSSGALVHDVGAATLTITADNKAKVYGAALPPLTVSYSGFVNGDTVASLTVGPVVTTTATASSGVQSTGSSRTRRATASSRSARC